MNELKSSFAGLLLIFIIAANPAYSFFGNESDKCLELGNNKCEEDGDCCSFNCFMELDNQQYGVCKHPKPVPKSKESDSSKECLPIGNDTCIEDNDCCSKNCVDKLSVELYGECKHPKSNITSSEESVSSKKCKPLGDNTCLTDEECCSSNCNIYYNEDTGVCLKGTLSASNEGTVYISANPDSIASNDIRNKCKHLGNNMCETDHECCSHYCHKRPADALFGTCDIPSSSRYSNGKDGIYEKAFCSFYAGVNTTANGEQYDEEELTAAHQTLPFNTFVRVAIMERHVAVRINDRLERKGLDRLQMSVRAALLLGIRNEEPLPCALTVLTDENCTPNFIDTCVMNYECCSRQCQRANKMELGKCVPRSD